METALEKSNRRLILIVTGFMGIVLGLFFWVVASIGALSAYAGVLLWFTALLARERADWSSQVNFYGEILVAFGSMAVIGGVLQMLLTVT